MEPWLEALIPSGIDVFQRNDGRYDVELRSRKKGSWPPGINQPFFLWSQRQTDPKQVVAYCRVIAREYHAWIEARRDQAQKLVVQVNTMHSSRGWQGDLAYDNRVQEMAAQARRRRAEMRAELAMERSERARKVFIMRREGATLAEIGAEFGIGKERVRQIFLKEERRVLRAVEAIRETKQHPKNPTAIKFETMPVSARVRNCVINEMGKDATLADVASRTREEWLRVSYFGRTSLLELQECLASHGLQLGERAPGWMKAQDAWKAVVGRVVDLDDALARFEAAVARCEEAGASADEVIAKVLEVELAEVQR